VPPLLEQSLARTADAVDRAERVGDPVLRFWAAVWRAYATECSGDVDETLRFWEIAHSLAARLDQPSLSWVLAFTRVVLGQIGGDIDEVEELATEAFRIGTDGNEPDAAAYYFGSHVPFTSWLRGTMGDIIPFMEQLVSDYPLLTGVRGFLALALVESDGAEPAAQLLADFAASTFALPMNPLWLTAMVEYAETAIALRATDHAGPLYERLSPYADRLSTSGGGSAEGLVSHYLGGLATLLGRYDDADARFARSAAFNDRVGAKFFGARTNLWWGRMLAERGAPDDVEKARDLLSKAHATAADDGYASVERRAAEALQHLP
jgi:hypothetical protein